MTAKCTHTAGRCSWLCGPHLEHCTLEKGHREDDCMCERENCSQLREAEVARHRWARERVQ